MESRHQKPPNWGQNRKVVWLSEETCKGGASVE